MLTEDELRGALAELSNAQPAAPTGRLDGVRRRHRNRARAQATVACLAVVAVVGGALGVVLSLRSTGASPAHRDVPSWALPWPDHDDGSLTNRQKDAAVRTWASADLAAASPDMPADVVWYAAVTVHHQMAVAIFEVTDQHGRHRLVSATNNTPNFPARCGNGCSDWAVYSAPAPPPSYNGPIGVNVQAGVEPAPNQYAPNWIAVIAPPAATRLRVTTLAMPAAKVVTSVVPLHSGYAAVDTGQLYGGPVMVKPLAPPGTSFEAWPVGLPGNTQSQIPQLAKVTVSHPGRLLSGFGGQETTSTNLGVSDKPRSGQLVLSFECRGSSVAQVRLFGGRPFVRQYPCDGREFHDKLPTLPAGRQWRSALIRAHEAAWDLVLSRVRR